MELVEALLLSPGLHEEKVKLYANRSIIYTNQHDQDTAKHGHWNIWSTTEKRQVLSLTFNSKECEGIQDLRDHIFYKVDLGLYRSTTNKQVLFQPKLEHLFQAELELNACNLNSQEANTTLHKKFLLLSPGYPETIIKLYSDHRIVYATSEEHATKRHGHWKTWTTQDEPEILSLTYDYQGRETMQHLHSQIFSKVDTGVYRSTKAWQILFQLEADASTPSTQGPQIQLNISTSTASTSMEFVEALFLTPGVPKEKVKLYNNGSIVYTDPQSDDTVKHGHWNMWSTTERAQILSLTFNSKGCDVIQKLKDHIFYKVVPGCYRSTTNRQVLFLPDWLYTCSLNSQEPSTIVDKSFLLLSPGYPEATVKLYSDQRIVYVNSEEHSTKKHGHWNRWTSQNGTEILALTYDEQGRETIRDLNTHIFSEIVTGVYRSTEALQILLQPVQDASTHSKERPQFQLNINTSIASTIKHVYLWLHPSRKPALLFFTHENEIIFYNDDGAGTMSQPNGSVDYSHDESNNTDTFITKFHSSAKHSETKTLLRRIACETGDEIRAWRAVNEKEKHKAPPWHYIRTWHIVMVKLKETRDYIFDENSQN